MFKLKVYYYSPYYFYYYWLFGCIPQAFHRKKNSITKITTKWDTAESIKLSSLNIRSLIKHSEDFENDCFLNKSDFLIKVISLSNITWLLYTDMPKKISYIRLQFGPHQWLQQHIYKKDDKFRFQSFGNSTYPHSPRNNWSYAFQMQKWIYYSWQSDKIFNDAILK